jgi:DNA repair exonuclease SbcCD ATPase subunit
MGTPQVNQKQNNLIKTYSGNGSAGAPTGSSNSASIWQSLTPDTRISPSNYNIGKNTQFVSQSVGDTLKLAYGNDSSKYWNNGLDLSDIYNNCNYASGYSNGVSFWTKLTGILGTALGAVTVGMGIMGLVQTFKASKAAKNAQKASEETGSTKTVTKQSYAGMRLSELTNRETELNSSLAADKEIRDNKEAAIAQAKAAVGDAVKDQKDKQGEITKNGEKQKAVNKGIKEAEKNLKKASKAVADIRKALETAKPEEVTALEANLQTCIEAENKARKALIEKEEELAELVKEKTTLDGELTKLSDATKQAEDALKALEKKIKNIDKVIAETEAELTEVKIRRELEEKEKTSGSSNEQETE